MECGRILIVGDNRETALAIRGVLDNQKFELEIALSSDVGRWVLRCRQMQLVLIHSGISRRGDFDLLDHVSREYTTPVVILGETGESRGGDLTMHEKPPSTPKIRWFPEPYRMVDVISFIRSL